MPNFQTAYYQNGWKTHRSRSIEAAMRFADKIKAKTTIIQIEEYRRMFGGKAFAWYPVKLIK